MKSRLEIKSNLPFLMLIPFVTDIRTVADVSHRLIKIWDVSFSKVESQMWTNIEGL